jgi:dephospho-CoA kinase
MKTNRFIGITGGIGTGKSTVSLFWSAYARLPLINIDQLCRELLEVEMPGWVALKANLDRSFFGPDGRLDRRGLRSALFDDDGLRHKVDQMMHPLALDLLHKKTVDLEGPILVDVPLLFEAGWENQFRRIVVVYADQQICCRRVSGRDGIHPEEAAKAIFSQMGIGEKAMLADHVVDNSYCWLLTRMQVSHLAELTKNSS